MSDDQNKIIEDAIQWAKKNKKRIAKNKTSRAIYPSEDFPVSVFMAGSPGAGKTESSKALIEEFDNNILRIDADDLRAEFNDYSGGNSWMFQGAVSIIVEKIHDLALLQKQSFILDGTLSNFEKAKSNIQRSLNKNRFVQILYVYQEPTHAWNFVKAREIVEGRKILKNNFIDQFFMSREVVSELKKEFSSQLQIDLLIQNYDNTLGLYKKNISKIDSYIAKNYSRQSLELELIED